jgi:hypothetical protein
MVPFGFDVPVLQFDVTLNTDAAVGAVTPLTLLQNGTLNGQTKFTAVSDNQGALTWTSGMAPSNSGNAVVDGSVTVTAPTPLVVPAPSVPVTPAPVIVPPSPVKRVMRVVRVHAALAVPTLPSATLTGALASPVPTVPVVATTSVQAPPYPSAEGLIAPAGPQHAIMALDEVFRQLAAYSTNGLVSDAGATASTETTDQNPTRWLEEVALVYPYTKRKSGSL